MTITAPEPLDARHRLADFSCGTASLDDWLKRQASKNQGYGAFRTFVACEGDRVVGYHALAAANVATFLAPGRFRRTTPEPVPVVVLGRLAVDRARQRHGLGRALFRDAAARVLQSASGFGIRTILAHAISPDVKTFFTALGFEPSPMEPMTLMVTLDDLRVSLG